MVDEMRFVGGKLDLHVKLTPSLLLDTEGRVLESCSPDTLLASGLLSRRALVDRDPMNLETQEKLTLHSAGPETWVEVVCDLVEETGGNLLSLVVDHVHLDGP